MKCSTLEIETPTDLHHFLDLAGLSLSVLFELGVPFLYRLNFGIRLSLQRLSVVQELGNLEITRD